MDFDHDHGIDEGKKETTQQIIHCSCAREIKENAHCLEQNKQKSIVFIATHSEVNEE